MRRWRLDQLAPLRVFMGRPDDGDWELVLWITGRAWVAR